jgi:hypothetical protein
MKLHDRKGATSTDVRHFSSLAIYFMVRPNHTLHTLLQNCQSDSAHSQCLVQWLAEKWAMWHVKKSKTPQGVLISTHNLSSPLQANNNDHNHLAICRLWLQYPLVHRQ